MSLPCDVETDCAMADEGCMNKKHLQFDPKYRHLPGGGPNDRFDSHDSGIDSFRSVDSSVCFSADSGHAESLLASISENASPLSQQLDNLHISSERQDGARTEAKKLDVEIDEDEAFVDSSATEESFGAAAGTTTVEEGLVQRGGWRFLTDDAFDQDQEGDTPLHLVIIHKEEETALRFIYCTSDPELFSIRNDLAQTPLHLSVLTRQPFICRALVLAGAQVDSIDRNGDTPLHIACKLGDDGCIRALTERVSPLELQRGMVQYRQQLPQNLELRNFEGFTCVHILGFLSNLEHLSYLVQLGANINAPDGKSGRTALHYAVEMDNLNVVHHLVRGLVAEINALTFDMCSPLHLAVGRGLKSIVMLLMESSADTDIVNFEGDRPCDLSQDSQIMMYVQNSVVDDDTMYTDIRIQGQ